MSTLIDVWLKVVLGEGKSWVLFKHGTCVIFATPEADLAGKAIELMKAWGPVKAGGSAGDFGVVALSEAPGWAVTSHHNDILTYVGPDEVPGGAAGDLMVGLLGRQKRDEDARELEILHIEAKRSM